MRPADVQHWQRTYERVRTRLLAERGDRPYWTGRLADSALATATAIGALALVDPQAHARGIAEGMGWLASNQNDDGGWGDTPDSPSNLPTSLLVVAATRMAGRMPRRTALRYVEREGGIGAILGLYGRDRTFSVPILTQAALAGLADWSDVPALPVELAVLPQRTFHILRMPVVSYAMPALIAVGLAKSLKSPPRRLLLRLLRRAVKPRLLGRLESIQPTSGGFLEAVPLTSFVAMSLIAAGRPNSLVVKRAVDFLLANRRDCGAWPIDSNLSVWNTTMAVRSLGDGEARTRDWLLEQQQHRRHPYVGSRPGGWGWSHLSGSVPDADDTAGALLALASLPSCKKSMSAVDKGLRWLIGLQNRDGGWPTFCRGWGKLPFDRSVADLTAHVLQALHRWRGQMPGRLGRQSDRAMGRGYCFLRRTQRDDGSWRGLWFGSQKLPDQSNPVFSTARVLLAYRQTGLGESVPARLACDYLQAAAWADGGWGAASGVPATIEETGAAIESLADEKAVRPGSVVYAGTNWLCDRIDAGGLDKPNPIGLYFACLWYHEKLYPICLAAAALRKVLSLTGTRLQSIATIA